MTARGKSLADDSALRRCTASGAARLLPKLAVDSVPFPFNAMAYTLQAVLAAGLLQLRPMKPRTVGLVGIVASVMNLYLLYPSLPPPSKKPGKVAEVMPSAQQSKMELKKA